MVCQVVAPIDSAASMIPESTSRTDCSIRRAIKGAMKIVRGTSAAVVPIEEPTITRVKGKIATIKIMKGSERTVLTTKFTTSWSTPNRTQSTRSVKHQDNAKCCT